MNAMVFTPRKGVRRAGLTLIELVVVLAILIALAGLLVPLLSDYLDSAHASSSATNISEVAKYIETHRARNFQYPTGFDSLLEAGTPANQITYIEITGDLTSTALTANTATSLAAAGITTVFDNQAGTPTEGASNSAFADLRTLAAGEQVATILEATATEWFGANAVAKYNARFGAVPVYVAFGVGVNNAMVGDLMLDAPLHYEADGGNPNTTYQRFIAVFAVDPNGDEPARLMGVVGPDGETLNEHSLEFAG